MTQEPNKILQEHLHEGQMLSEIWTYIQDAFYMERLYYPS